MKNGEELEVRKGIVRKSRRLRVLFAYTMAAVLTFTAIPTTVLHAEPGDSGSGEGGETPGGGEGVETHTHQWKYSVADRVITAWCEGTGDCEYSGTSESHDHAVTLTLDAPDADYNEGNYQSATVTPSVDTGTVDPWGTYTIEYKDEPGQAASQFSVGNYTASLTVQGVTATDSFQILPANPSVTYPEAIPNLEYDGQEHSLVTAGSVTGGTIKYILNGVEYNAPPVATHAGDYLVSYTITVDSDHSNPDPVSGEVSVSIAKRPVTVSEITAENKTYNGTAEAELNCRAAVLTGRIGEDDLSVTATGSFADANAGNGKTVVISEITLGGDASSDYEPASTGQQSTATANITPKLLDITWQNTDLTYNGSEQAPTPDTTGIISGDTCNISVAGGETHVNAPGENYTATASLSNSNYSIRTGETANFTIGPKSASSVTFSLNPGRFAYDGNEKTPELKVFDGNTELINGTDYEISADSALNGTECGNYTINITGKGDYKDGASTEWEIYDNTAPTATITVEDYETPFTTFLNNITFNIFYKEKKQVTITATDRGTGIKEEGGLGYYLSETAMSRTELAGVTFTPYSEAFEIDAERDYVIYARVEDKAGHIVYVSSNGIVIDVTPPAVTLTSGALHEESDYFGPVSYQIADKDLKEVTVSAVGETSGSSTTDLTITDGKTAEGSAAEVGSYIISATDMAGNRTTESFQIKRADGVVTPINKEYTYITGRTYDVSGLFEIDKSKGTGDAESYEVISGGSGHGRLNGTALSISKAGTIKIRIVTKQEPYVKSMTTTAVLTVRKGSGSAYISAKDAQYGELPTIEPWTTTNEGKYTLSFREEGGKKESGTIPVNVGKYTVRVTYPENDLYRSASAQTTFSITKAPHEEMRMEKTTIPSGGVTGRELDLKKCIETDPALAVYYQSHTVEGDIAGAVSDIHMDGTKLVYSVGETAEGQSGTIVVTVSTWNYQDYPIVIPIESKKKVTNVTTVTLEDGNSIVAAAEQNGLENYTKRQSGQSVEVEMKIDPKEESDLSESEKQGFHDAVDNVYSGVEKDNVEIDYLEISVNKTTVRSNGQVEEAQVTDLGSVVEIVLTLKSEIQDNRSPVVFREHNGKVIQFKRLYNDHRTGSGYRDATFYLSGKMLYLYTRYYSVYSIAYTKDPSATVTYDYGDKTEQKVVILTDKTTVTYPGEPVKDGCQFAGWYGVTDGVMDQIPWDFNNIITGDTTIKAKWEQTGGGGGASGGSRGSAGGNAGGNAGATATVTGEGTALSGVIVSVYEKNDEMRAASMSATLSGGTKTFAARAPKTGDTLPPLWLLAILFASGGTMIVIYILSAYARLRKGTCEDVSSR